MKKILFISVLLFPMSCTHAQLLKKILDKTKQKTEEKVSEKVSDKVSDAASKPIDNAGKSNKNTETGNRPGGKNAAGTNSAGGSDDNKDRSESPTLSYYSKFDFIPGEKILVFEDFSQDAIGDFPAKWNTNSSGEVVTANSLTGHWLMISKKGRFIPDYITSLPDNF